MIDDDFSTDIFAAQFVANWFFTIFLMQLEVLPLKSCEKYLRYYKQFQDFHKDKFPEFSVDDAVVQYLLSLREKKLKISTLRTYISAITSCLTNDNIKLDDCTYKRIMLYLTRWRGQGGPPSPKFPPLVIFQFIIFPSFLRIFYLFFVT